MAATPQACLALYFKALHECDAEAFRQMWHPLGHLLGLGPDGAVVDRDSEAFLASATSRDRSTDLAVHDRILALTLVDETCAAAKVQIALPPLPTSPTPTMVPTLYTDLVTMLCENGEWRIISKVYSPAPLGEQAAAAKLVPADFGEVAAAVWGGYVAAARAGDAAAMGRVFHPCSNLTFATPGGVVVVPSDAFCRRCEERWQMADFAPYAHLREDPRAAAADTLLSVDFAGPGVAVVTLKIGFPPVLYTDVLLLLRLGAPVAERGGPAGWWIVAKSSGNVPFLREEAKA